MVAAKLAAGPEAYRLEKDRAFFIWVLFALLAAVSRASNIFYPAFALLPLAFLLTRVNAYRFMILLMAGYFLFFPPGARGVNFYGLFAADSLTFAFLLLFLFSRASDREPMHVPFSPTLAGIYVFSAYALVLTSRSLGSATIPNIFYDLKNIFYLLLVPLLMMLDGRNREPKKFFLLIGAFVLFCTLHSLQIVAEFLLTGARIITWNEIYISDCVVIAAVMLRFRMRARTRWLVRGALLASAVALIATQTRGLWLSTVAALGFYYAMELVRGRNFRPANLVKIAVTGVLSFVVANVAFAILSGVSLVDFIAKRFDVAGFDEFLNPYASMGYRIHEAWAVWDVRTWFGHGPGATIHLFFTQLPVGKFLDWWSIHSGYFEFLHKFGFVGLAIILWMFGSYYFLARRLARSSSRATATFGGIIGVVLMNHFVVSITSGYLLRHGVIVWIPLFFIAERLRTHMDAQEKKKAASAAAERAAARSPGAPAAPAESRA